MSATDPTAKLAHMAGHIAEFFKSYPEDQAVAAIADHINQFWSWRMREDFVTAFRPDDPALAPLVAKALAGIKGKRPTSSVLAR
ncbi:formate dehydrogenase subunit delta [Phreatobacter stygius]|uniref:Formate dehydrogenase subunit delta n=1 Tax=Phreatobacter stygius TaxID=1940610 RepID=A0A4D7B963_9HYPH|nr:formate dehydrogenase subunit delta [Phreatobacter stygius]QCI67040.1 formate dehydrogenase subunit delta [Phreatobacter stygius]